MRRRWSSVGGSAAARWRAVWRRPARGVPLGLVLGEAGWPPLRDDLAGSVTGVAPGRGPRRRGTGPAAAAARGVRDAARRVAPPGDTRVRGVPRRGVGGGSAPGGTRAIRRLCSRRRHPPPGAHPIRRPGITQAAQPSVPADVRVAGRAMRPLRGPARRRSRSWATRLRLTASRRLGAVRPPCARRGRRGGCRPAPPSPACRVARRAPCRVARRAPCRIARRGAVPRVAPVLAVPGRPPCAAGSPAVRRAGSPAVRLAPGRPPCRVAAIAIPRRLNGRSQQATVSLGARRPLAIGQATVRWRS